MSLLHTHNSASVLSTALEVCSLSSVLENTATDRIQTPLACFPIQQTSCWLELAGGGKVGPNFLPMFLLNVMVSTEVWYQEGPITWL